MSAPNWLTFLIRILKAVARWRVTRIATGIAEDVVITACLLVGLKVIHGVLLRVDASDQFKEFFDRLHECSCIGGGVLVSIRGLYRIATTR
jgi:hypothetical protein